jgi:hypothetical protein
MSTIEAEGEWLVSQEEKTKAVFLATLAHAITIAGRNSYTVQSEELDKPSQLRKINEIQHRVLSCLREVLNGQANASFQRSSAIWVLEQPDKELQELMSWAWNTSKEKSP